MKIVEQQGDLLDWIRQYKADVVAHGCNCKKVMGAGIARLLADAYPEVAQADQDKARVILGSYSHATLSSGVVVCNAYTQIYPGRPYPPADSVEVRLQAIADSLERIALSYLGRRIAIPRIGAGLAGLSWSDVSAAIEAVPVNQTIHVVVKPVKARPAVMYTTSLCVDTHSE